MREPGATGLAGLFSGPEIDWEDIHLRVTRPAPIGADAGAISPDGNRVAFHSTSGDDLWVATADGKQVVRVTTGGQRPRQIRWSQKNPTTVYFLDGSGTIRVANAGSPSPSEPARVSFSAKLTRPQSAVASWRRRRWTSGSSPSNSSVQLRVFRWTSRTFGSLRIRLTPAAWQVRGDSSMSWWYANTTHRLWPKWSERCASSAQCNIRLRRVAALLLVRVDDRARRGYEAGCGMWVEGGS